VRQSYNHILRITADLIESTHGKNNPGKQSALTIESTALVLVIANVSIWLRTSSWQTGDCSTFNLGVTKVICLILMRSTAERGRLRLGLVRKVTTPMLKPIRHRRNLNRLGFLF
jgi:hypothetical protein